MAEPDWDLYRTFLAVLRAGSLSGAARTLGLAQPTVGRQIDALEAALGLTLFVRSQLGFLPTEHALQLRPYAESLSATASALLRAASSEAGQARGTVRIAASEAVGIEVLPPILTALHGQYPQLHIELSLSNAPEDLLRREADIAIRMVRPTQDALVARRVGVIALGLHARRDYLARRGTPTSLAELDAHALIGFDHENAFIRRVKQQLGGLTRASFALRADSDLAQLAAIRAGFGIGVCQVNVARRDPQLVHVLPAALAIELDTWVVMHEDLRESRRCSVVFAALVDGITSYIDG